MYLCDELQPDDLNDTLKNAILHSLITNVSMEEANLEATKLAVKALPNSIAYAKNIFGNDTDRDFLMDKIFTACQLQQEEIQEYALHTLREIGIQQYDHLELYFTKVLEVTILAAGSQSDRVGAQAYEFWTTLAEEEVERAQKQQTYKGYIQRCKDQLLNIITQGLLVITFDEDQDDEEWGHALSAACCLQKVALLLKSEVIDQVI